LLKGHDMARMPRPSIFSGLIFRFPGRLEVYMLPKRFEGKRSRVWERGFLLLLHESRFPDKPSKAECPWGN
jgi:hypothetical protein